MMVPSCNLSYLSIVEPWYDFTKGEFYLEEKPLEFEFERWERIDSVIYDMTPPPSSQHQAIVGNLYGEFYTYLKGKHCKAFPAPFGVWLDDENETLWLRS